MGASEFTVVMQGKTARAAFLSAVAEAREENGNGGYSGSIAEKSKFVMISTEPMPKADAFEKVDNMLASDDPRISDKWGPAGCIEIEIEPEGDEKTYIFFGYASS